MVESIRLELDQEAGAGYIVLRDAAVDETVSVDESTLVDLDEFGVAIGVEVLRLDAEIPFARLEQEFHIPSGVAETLRLIRPNLQSFALSATSGPDGVSHSVARSGNALA